jgi:hypothetical protein
MTPTRVNVIGFTAFGTAVTLVIFLTLDAASAFDVSTDVIIALTGLGSSSGVAYVACRVGDTISTRTLGRLDLLEAELHQIRRALAALPDAVDDEVETRLAGDRIDALRDLAVPANNHEVTPLRSVSR